MYSAWAAEKRLMGGQYNTIWPCSLYRFASLRKTAIFDGDKINKMTNSEINNMIDRIKARCERPSRVVSVGNYFTCERGFTLRYSGGTLEVKPGYHVSFYEDVIAVRATSRHEIDTSASLKQGLLSALSAGIEALGADEHRIRWQAISGMTESGTGQTPRERPPEPSIASGTHEPRCPPGDASSIDLKVKWIIAETLGIDLRQADSNASFVDDLCADSLDLVELCLAAEEAFELDIPDEDAEKITTVGDAIAYIVGKKR
jgi:acyl carrier protein